MVDAGQGPTRDDDPRRRRIPLALNGKFLKAGFTAVHLAARQYLRELPLRMEKHPVTKLLGPATLYVRRGTGVDEQVTSLRSREVGHLPGLLWEQLELPAHARGQLLVNFCNLGPVLSRDAIAFVHDLHTFEIPGSFSRAFVVRHRLILNRIGTRHRRILTVSQYSRNCILRHGVARPESVRVILNGVDHALRAPSDPAIIQRLRLTPSRYVLALASTYAHKNLGVLLSAFGHGSDDGLRLVLFGAADANDFRRAGMTPSDRVVFTGWVNDGERRALYEHALCFAFPSTTEGFGLPPAEAMLLGCPAVVTSCAAIPEVCGDAAMYADPHQPREWVDAFNALAADVEKRAALSSRGRARMGALTWAKATDALLDVIAEVVEEIESGR